MEVYGILGLLENAFNLSKNQDDKRLTLQQKFVYVLHKKQDITIQSVKDKLYNQALQYLNDINYHSIRQVLEDYIGYYQNNINIDDQNHDILNFSF
jgi:hypothetical protein